MTHIDGQTQNLTSAEEGLNLQKSFASEYVPWAQGHQGFMGSLTFIKSVPLRPTISNNGVPTYKLTKYLAGLPSSLVGRSSYHVTNSIEFVHTFGSLRVKLEDMMVSFNIVFLFT